MRDPRFSALCADAKANAACALLSGGLLMLFSGDRPDGASDAARESNLLAALRFGTPAFNLAERGRAEARRIEPSPGLRSGRPTWFRCVTKLGEPVFDGACGPLVPDEGYDLYVTAEVEQDGEVRVGQLVYTEQAT